MGAFQNVFGSSEGGTISLSEGDIASIVSGIYASLSGIAPTVSLTYDPRTLEIQLTDGDDWKNGVRTIDIPIELPDGVDYNDCTVTFGAVKGSARIDKQMELFLDGDELNVRLLFDRDDTLAKPDGRYKYDVEVQYTDSESVVSSITVLEGILTLRAGIAKLPADI